jgi:hypothetical protein
MVPVGPTLTVGAVFTLPGEVQAMAARDSRLFVCIRPPSPDSATKLFYIVDASDPMNPQVVGSALDHGQYGWVYGLALYGSYAYINTYSKGLAVLDISNPAAPGVLATYDTLATIPKGVSGTHLFGVGYGLDYLSLADPVHPKLEGRLTNARVSNLVAPWDETRCAFLRYDNDQINIADFSIPTSPRIVAWSSPIPNGLAFCAGSLFAVTGNSSPGILRFTWDGGDSIYQAGKADLTGSAICLATLGNRIIVGTTSRINPNLYLLSATGPQSPYVVGECSLPGPPCQLTADGNRIFAVLEGGGNWVAIEVTEH